MSGDHKIDNGGPAFPTSSLILPQGMTLRDHFAGLAMQALIAGHIAHYGHENYWPSKDLVSSSLEYADAMLKARQEGGAA